MPNIFTKPNLKSTRCQIYLQNQISNPLDAKYIYKTKSQIDYMPNIFTKPNLKSTKCQIYLQNQISNLLNVKYIYKTKSQIY
jgi:hypothetical protein